MILTSPWQLRMLLGAAGTSVDFVTHSVDDSGTTLSYVNERGSSNGTTPVTIVSAPGSGNRVITYVEIVNRDSITHNVTIHQFDTTNTRLTRTYAVPAGSGIWYVRGEGWKVIEANGGERSFGFSGSDGSILYVSAGSPAAAGNALIDGSELALQSIATPAPPAASRVKLFGRGLAGRVLPAAIGPSGRNTSLQPFLGRNRIGEWKPIGNATIAPLADGIAAPTATGTATSRTVAVTNMATSMRRLGYVSAAAAGSLAGARLAAAQIYIGDGVGGGFMLVMRFVPSDAATVSGARMFCGLSTATGAPTNVEPNTLTNVLGVCQLSTSTNLHLIRNDGSGTATTVDLGANFPAATLSADAYELILFSNSGDGQVGYRVERLNTGDVSEGTWTTDIPTSTTLLAVQAWRTNNATALAVGLDLVSLYLETDF